MGRAVGLQLLEELGHLQAELRHANDVAHSAQQSAADTAELVQLALELQVSSMVHLLCAGVQDARQLQAAGEFNCIISVTWLFEPLYTWATMLMTCSSETGTRWLRQPHPSPGIRAGI